MYRALRLAVEWRLAAFASLMLVACGSRPTEPQAELVGDPLGAWRTSPAEAYARNLWDLQEHQGRLYLGYGDAISNTGPTSVIAYDPRVGEFSTETVLPEEAILTFHVFDERLYIPGVDAVESSDGAVYVRDANGWRTLPLPGVVHASDVIRVGTRLCVAVQDRTLGGAVRCSDDDGATWSSFPTGGFRAVSLFELDGTMYVSSHDSGVRRINRDGTATETLSLDGVLKDPDVLVSKPVTCGHALAFIAKRITYRNGGGDVSVLGLFHTAGESLLSQSVALDGTPTDLFANAGKCYALVDRAEGQGHAVTLLRSDDGVTWTRMVGLHVAALARSAELMDGYIYIGTGCDAGQCSDTVGRLLRIKMP
ncbi:MAG TPA: hypothetical protein VGM90_00355 [Kofleriaceae bacterium]|jgi:hypothetical protein